MYNRTFTELLHGADYNYEQWLDYPEIHDQDFKLMKDSGSNAMTIGIFSWAKLEPEEGKFDFDWLDKLMDRLHYSGMKAILATPSGSKPAWLSYKYPEVCMVDKNGKREAHGFRHNHCRTSPVYREKCITINTKLAERYKDHPALILWHVSNEYGASPCYCKHCMSDFRDWLKKRYTTLDNLNKAWWTSFWSHTFSDWKQIEPVDSSIHGLILDWQRFISDQTLDFFKTELAPLREISPHIPITTNFMKPDVGLDYWAFAPYVDVISWDNYPQWHLHEEEWVEGVKTSFYHDLHRSMKDQSFMMMESTPNVTNWQGISIPKRENMHQLSSIQAVAHGSDTVQYFQWRQSRGGQEKFHGAVINQLSHGNTKVFRDVSHVGATLKNLKEVCGAEINAEVAIIYDFQSEWAINNAQLARNYDKDYQERCITHYRSFWKMGIPVDIKDCSCTDFSRYKVIIAPMLYMLRENIHEKIKKFTADGGLFITTYMSGLVNDSDLCFLGGSPGPLGDLLGIWVEDTDIMSEHHQQSFNYDGNSFKVKHFADRIHVTTAEICSVFENGLLKGAPSITENIYGKGRAVYLTSRTHENFYDHFYKNIAEKYKLNKRYVYDLPDGVTVQYRVKNGSEYAFFMNFTSQAIEIPNPDGFWYDLIEKKELTRGIHIPQYGMRVFRFNNKIVE
ncbi:MAG: beta-galactosidase [Spirochaetaceae bacterium]|jgi:beta-galactosidase|nr:beta-galactosidase [Spirochaetaceae bacterium]